MSSAAPTAPPLIKVGDIISHSELKKFSRGAVVVPFVCNPKQANSTHGFINGNFYKKCVDGLPGFKHLLADLHSYRNPPAFETPFFKEVVAGVFDIEHKLVVLLHCLPGILHLSYEVVSLVSAQGYIESEHQVAEADRLEALLKEGWSVLCGYAQQDLHKQMHHVSSYSIGVGPMIHTSTFNLLKFDNFEGSPMDIAAADLKRYVSKRENSFSDAKINELSPSRSLSKERPPKVPVAYVREHLKEFRGSGKDLDNDPMFAQYVIDLVANLEFNNSVFEAVVRLYTLACDVVGSAAYWGDWTGAFTHCCNIDPEHPCNSCNGCNMLMCQVAMAVVAAQGVADKNMLASLGAVFRHPRYAHLDSKNFLALGLTELTLLFKRCSKQALNAHHFFYFLWEVENGGGPPTHIEDLTCFRGFSEKSACLYFLAMLHILLGIAADLHVIQKSIALSLVPAGAGKNASLVAKMLEQWIPVDKWELWNNVLGGTAQIMDSSLKAEKKVQRLSFQLGKTYIDICRIMTPDRKMSIWNRGPDFHSQRS
jgi:endonuclease III